MNNGTPKAEDTLSYKNEWYSDIKNKTHTFVLRNIINFQMSKIKHTVSSRKQFKKKKFPFHEERVTEQVIALKKSVPTPFARNILSNTYVLLDPVVFFGCYDENF